jgi:pimeloyl-ACP methyl ester carboxylesterase
MHQHSEHLYIFQILAVLASSELSWTCQDPFHIIGYSLGGGIAAAFARYHPNMVSSLVMVAPGGLVRQKHVAWQSYLLYHTNNMLPGSLIRRLVRARLDNPAAATTRTDDQPHDNNTTRPEDAMTAELGGAAASKAAGSTAQLMDEAVQWQVHHHRGFVDAFISSIRFAPISGQHETFRQIGQSLRSRTRLSNATVGNKAILVLGMTDSIVVREEVEEDVTETVGPDHVHTIVLDTGHDIPISMPRELVDSLWEFWNQQVKC